MINKIKRGKKAPSLTQGQLEDYQLGFSTQSGDLFIRQAADDDFDNPQIVYLGGKTISGLVENKLDKDFVDKSLATTPRKIGVAGVLPGTDHKIVQDLTIDISDEGKLLPNGKLTVTKTLVSVKKAEQDIYSTEFDVFGELDDRYTQKSEYDNLYTYVKNVSGDTTNVSGNVTNLSGYVDNTFLPKAVFDGEGNGTYLRDLAIKPGEEKNTAIITKTLRDIHDGKQFKIDVDVKGVDLGVNFKNIVEYPENGGSYATIELDASAKLNKDFVNAILKDLNGDNGVVQDITYVIHQVKDSTLNLNKIYNPSLDSSVKTFIETERLKDSSDIEVIELTKTVINPESGNSTIYTGLVPYISASKYVETIDYLIELIKKGDFFVTETYQLLLDETAGKDIKAGTQAIVKKDEKETTALGKTNLYVYADDPNIEGHNPEWRYVYTLSVDPYTGKTDEIKITAQNVIGLDPAFITKVEDKQNKYNDYLVKDIVVDPEHDHWHKRKVNITNPNEPTNELNYFSGSISEVIADYIYLSGVLNSVDKNTNEIKYFRKEYNTTTQKFEVSNTAAFTVDLRNLVIDEGSWD